MRCRKHSKCKKIEGSDHVFSFVNCPWCGYNVNVSNMCKWCANCYVKYKVEDGYVHFSKDFEKTMAEHWAIAINKVGGMSMGQLTKDDDEP